jgi:hypothetical protein
MFSSSRSSTIATKALIHKGMRRDYFTLDVTNVDGEDETAPVVNIKFDGPSEQLSDRLADDGGELFKAAELDIAYRLHGPVNDEDTTGVVAVTNRVTGEFILELNAPARNVVRFIDAARAYGKAADDDTRFQVNVFVDDEPLAEYEKSTLLVYDPDGGLLRQHSLIPSGVEL